MGTTQGKLHVLSCLVIQLYKCDPRKIFCKLQCCWIRNQDAKNTQHHKISIYPDSVVAASSMNITCYIYPPPLLTKLVLCVIESDREYLFRDLARWMATNFKLSIREHNYKLSDSLLSNSTRRMRSQDQ